MGVRPRLWLTPLLQRRVAYLGARGSYESAAENLAELIDVEVSQSEFQRVTNEWGQRFDRLSRAEDDERLRPASPERPAPAPELRPERLVAMSDATCVLTVPGEEHKSVHTGRAFDLTARGDVEPGERPFLTDSRYAASAVNFEDFGHRFKALLHRCGLRTAKDVAFVADGARCLWRWAEDNLPGAVLIQDFWHVAEHLARLAKDLYGEGFEPTLERWKQMLRASRIETLLDELRELRRTRRGAKRKRLAEEIAYLEAGKSRMDYARYRREGWPIGSGAIEGVCKHLVKQRFAVTGAQWRRANLPKVLALRVAQFNGDFDRYANLTIAARATAA